MTLSNENHEKQPVPGFMQKLPNGDMSWYDLMDKMIGSKRQRFGTVMVPPVGIPQAPRLPEEIRIQRAMDSCLFKSVMSCVIGKCLDTGYEIGRYIPSLWATDTCRCTRMYGQCPYVPVFAYRRHIAQLSA